MLIKIYKFSQMTGFDWLLTGMAIMGAIVFVALYFIKAGYGMFFDRKWGLSVSNKLGWILMESPVFLLMGVLWWFSDRRCELAPVVIFGLFQLHYIHRAFIYPFLMRGKSRMPVGIMAMGVVFNILNAAMQGGWFFYYAPAGMYTAEWLLTPQFIFGTVVFFTGMGINMHSDHIIRNLRKPGDTAHYLPRGGMYDYVTSANYFGEIVEWCGFAILTWSWAGAVFAWWTFANLVPRAAAIYRCYQEMYGSEVKERGLKRIIPFIY